MRDLAQNAERLRYQLTWEQMQQRMQQQTRRQQQAQQQTRRQQQHGLGHLSSARAQDESLPAYEPPPPTYEPVDRGRVAAVQRDRERVAAQRQARSEEERP